MDTYAVVLYFDSETSDRLHQAIADVSVITGNHYMIDVKIPPHITIGLFYSEESDSIIEKCEELLKRMEPFEVKFSGAGAFRPRVIYASPIKDSCLEHINSIVHEMFLSNFQAADQENYIPAKWVPHCGLAVKLEEEQFKKVSMAEINLPASGTVQKIALARCNPYQEIRVWKIEGDVL